ncbi:uncharacterized protein LOC143288440 [Babylonia areolata]|uniref:uncharacterized protein LOC143288440 n=1 Tax=Babylonia areolata TaxID=304850 RepID=UPI003FD0EF5E
MSGPSSVPVIAISGSSTLTCSGRMATEKRKTHQAHAAWSSRPTEQLIVSTNTAVASSFVKVGQTIFSSSNLMTEQLTRDSTVTMTGQVCTTSSSMLTTGQPTVDNSVFLDYMNGLQVYKWILVAAVIPVCIVGLAGNTVSVWVWNANRKHNSVVLLFQCLGLVDNAFLLVTVVRSCLHYADQLPQEKEVIIIPVLLLFHSWSVHVTMVIGISRWLAVARHAWMQRIRRRQIVMVCGGLGIWCGLLSGLTHMNKEVHRQEAEEEYLTMTLVILVVQFILPNLVLMGFSISLMRLVCQRYSQGRSKVSHRGRTTMTVLGIAGCSLLSCVIVESSKLVAMLPHEVSDLHLHLCFYPLRGRHPRTCAQLQCQRLPLLLHLVEVQSLPAADCHMPQHQTQGKSA